MNKLFIIGLPRTGTTSISVALLDYGFKVAHTAFTKQAFHLADAISDAPCFSDYQQLDALFPGSKFIYLERDLDKWIPSIVMLLTKMQDNIDLKSGSFSPVLKRSFHAIFGSLDQPDGFSETRLRQCYLTHQSQVFEYFKNRDDLLKLDVSECNGLGRLLDFLNIDHQGNLNFPHVNKGKFVDHWKDTKHPNKVNPNSAGIEHRKFFDY